MEFILFCVCPNRLHYGSCPSSLPSVCSSVYLSQHWRFSSVHPDSLLRFWCYINWYFLTYLHLWSASHGQLQVPRIKIATYRSRDFGNAGPPTWNALPNTLKCSSHCLPTFRCHLKHFHFSFYYDIEHIRGYTWNVYCRNLHIQAPFTLLMISLDISKKR